MALETWLMENDLDTVLRVNLIHLQEVPWRVFQRNLVASVDKALDFSYPLIAKNPAYRAIVSGFMATPEPCELKSWNDKNGFGPYVRIRIRRHFEVQFKKEVQAMLHAYVASVAKKRNWYSEVNTRLEFDDGKDGGETQG